MAAMAGPARAQAPLTITSDAVTGGGGTSAGGEFRVTGAIGQAVATGTASTGGGFLLNAGLFGAPAATPAAPVLGPLTNRETQPGTPALVALTIADDGPVSAVTVTAFSSNLVLVPASGLSVSGTGAQRTLTVTPVPGQSGDSTITVVATDATGLTDTRTFVLSVRVEAPSTTFTYYLAEGATSSFFDTRIALLNPGLVDTVATLRFLPAGRDSVFLDVPLPAGARRTVRVKEVPGLAEAEFSTSITSSQPIVVDRTMTWGEGGYGSHAETAVTAPSPVWYLAEGATHSGFALFYLLQNPADTATRVRVRYLRATGAPLVKEYDLLPRSRTNIWVNVEEFDGLGRALEAAELSAVIESINGTPIIVERAMYRSTQGRVFNAGHESAGVTAPAMRWFLAEGRTGAFFDQFVLIANPGNADAQVRVSYLLADGTTYTKDMVAPANARSGIWVDFDTIPGVPGFPLADVALSTTVESTNNVPIIVERAMWWPGDGNTWHEAHNSSGATDTGTVWAMADGEVGGPSNAQTYVLIANTSAFGGRARVTLRFEDGGAPMTLDYPLLPSSRTNAAIGPDFGDAVAGRAFGIVVEALGVTDGDPTPRLVVERAMYSDAGGVALAAGTNALATKVR